MANDQQLKVRAGERIDQIAERAFDNPMTHGRIVTANPDINIFYPLPDQVLTIKHD